MLPLLSRALIWTIHTVICAFSWTNKPIQHPINQLFTSFLSFQIRDSKFPGEENPLKQNRTQTSNKLTGNLFQLRNVCYCVYYSGIYRPYKLFCYYFQKCFSSTTEVNNTPINIVTAKDLYKKKKSLCRKDSGFYCSLRKYWIMKDTKSTVVIICLFYNLYATILLWLLDILSKVF